MGNREYSVSDSGEITRLPFEFRIHNGAIAIKKSIILKPTKTEHGYMRVCLAAGHMFVHRIVWYAFNGEVPEGIDIDHINGERSDNRIENLRLATRKENALNRKRANSNSVSGVRGVYFHRSSGCWVFSVSGKHIKSSRNKDIVVDIANKYHGL